MATEIEDLNSIIERKAIKELQNLLYISKDKYRDSLQTSGNDIEIKDINGKLVTVRDMFIINALTEAAVKRQTKGAVERAMRDFVAKVDELQDQIDELQDGLL